MPEIKEKSKETIKQLDKNIVQLQKLKKRVSKIKVKKEKKDVKDY